MAFDMTNDERRSPRALVAWLVEQAEVSDNISEFIHVVLRQAWTEVGLPGDLPCDQHGFIDLGAVQRVQDGLRRWPALDTLAANATEYEARFYSFERAEDVRAVETVGLVAGFETYPFRRELVVVDPDSARRSTMTEGDRAKKREKLEAAVMDEDETR
jgi:hypothetical protein